jgi:coenzyme PQQ precursor peptide PqqA
MGGTIMKKWTSPRVREICVGMEINSYASARV